nr:TolC family protein [Flammeovirga sp. MY04]
MVILYPPPIPPLGKGLFFVFLFLLESQHLIAQNSISVKQNFDTISIAKLTDLEESIMVYYQKDFIADYIAWQDDGKGRIWSYMPDVGFAFGLPTMNLSTRHIKSAKKQEKQRKQKLESIKEKRTLLMNTDIQKLRVLYEKFINDQEQLAEKMKVLEIDQKILDIYTEGYEQNEIDPLTYLNQQKSHLQSELIIHEFIRNLQEQKTMIYILAKYQLPNYTLAVENLPEN